MLKDKMQVLREKQQAVNDCLQRYGLPKNPAINDSFLLFNGVPSKPSKGLAFLILAYKREATTEELKKISDQPAGLVKDLRKDGFIFQESGDGVPRYYYHNSNGEVCRKITSYKPLKAEIKGKVKLLIEKSVAACVSAIEIYNKPDFKYREETFSILLVNAWELLLKAKVLSDGNHDIKSIQAIDSSGNAKTNRSGNPLTIDIMAAINKLVSREIIDDRCRENIGLLVEIRDNAIHFTNKSLDFSKKVQEIGIASLRNYTTAISEWFGRDLSQYNFYLMPMSFFHLSDIDSHSVLSQDKQMQRLLSYFQKIEAQYPFNEDNTYCITLQIKTHFVRSAADPNVFEVRYTDRKDAPEIRITEENVFKNKYPLPYNSLVDKLKDRYSDFRQDNQFHKIKKELEDTEKHGEKYCKVNYLNVVEKKGSKQKFYSLEIIKEFDKHYTKIK
jgi:hypothetical protein